MNEGARTVTTPLDGKIDILTAPLPSGQVTITLNGTAGDVLVGGSGQAGAVLVRDGEGKTIVRIASATPSRPQVGGLSLTPTGGITIYDGDGHTIITLTTAGDVVIGGNGVAGDVMLKRKDGQTSVSLRGDAAENIFVRDHSGKPVLTFVGDAFDNKIAGCGSARIRLTAGRKRRWWCCEDKRATTRLSSTAERERTSSSATPATGPSSTSPATRSTERSLASGSARRRRDGGKKPGLIVLRDNVGTRLDRHRRRPGGHRLQQRRLRRGL